jgi:hypothetical protein
MYNPAQHQSPSGGASYTFAASVADALLYQFKEYARFAVVSIVMVYFVFIRHVLFDFPMRSRSLCYPSFAG